LKFIELADVVSDVCVNEHVFSSSFSWSRSCFIKVTGSGGSAFKVIWQLASFDSIFSLLPFVDVAMDVVLLLIFDEDETFLDTSVLDSMFVSAIFLFDTDDELFLVDFV